MALKKKKLNKENFGASAKYLDLFIEDGYDKGIKFLVKDRDINFINEFDFLKNYSEKFQIFGKDKQNNTNKTTSTRISREELVNSIFGTNLCNYMMDKKKSKTFVKDFNFNFDWLDYLHPNSFPKFFDHLNYLKKDDHSALIEYVLDDPKFKEYKELVQKKYLLNFYEMDFVKWKKYMDSLFTFSNADIGMVFSAIQFLLCTHDDEADKKIHYLINFIKPHIKDKDYNYLNYKSLLEKMGSSLLHNSVSKIFKELSDQKWNRVNKSASPLDVFYIHVLVACLILIHNKKSSLMTANTLNLAEEILRENTHLFKILDDKDLLHWYGIHIHFNKWTNKKIDFWEFLIEGYNIPLSDACNYLFIKDEVDLPLLSYFLDKLNSHSLLNKKILKKFEEVFNKKGLSKVKLLTLLEQYKIKCSLNDKGLGISNLKKKALL